MSIFTISAAELKSLCGEGKPINLIDVRTPVEYREVHVEAARNIPLDQLDPAALMRESITAAGQPLYLICRSGSRGRQACERLLAAGLPNVINVEGGTLACTEAGVPIVRGKKSMSLERQVRIAAGSLVLVGTVLGFVQPVFFAVPLVIGSGLIFAGITDTCGMAMMLARMPWNQVSSPTNSCPHAENIPAAQ